MSDAAEPFVGKQLRERGYAISENLLRDYYNGLQLDAHAGALADFVPTSVACDAEGGYFNEIAFPNHIGHLWMKQEWRATAPSPAAAATPPAAASATSIRTATAWWWNTKRICATTAAR